MIKMSKKIAVIRIRGTTGVKSKIARTLVILHLFKRNTCTVIEDRPEMVGMLQVVKDFVTWGEIDDETYKLLAEKRGEKDPKDEKSIKPFFRLNSPSKGFERKGIKVPFSLGGALGNRKEKINNLIKRMI
jgi:large subunit ribosomal protein L30